MRRHFEWRGNLEALFADRVILTEGDHDELFYEKLMELFGVARPVGKFTLFVKMNSSKALHKVRDFYKRIGIEDVAAIVDLDWLFSTKVKPFLDSLGIDPTIIDGFRAHIGWAEEGDPGLQKIVERIDKLGEPTHLVELIKSLEGSRVFVLRKGAPEHYSMFFPGQKKMLYLINDVGDLREPYYLADLINKAVLGE